MNKTTEAVKAEGVHEVMREAKQQRTLVDPMVPGSLLLVNELARVTLVFKEMESGEFSRPVANRQC